MSLPALRATTSASNLHRRVRCPGSHWAEHGLAEIDSEFSEEGTLLHSGIEASSDNLHLTDKQRELIDSTREIFREVIDRTMAALAIPPETPFLEGYERALRIKKGIRTVLPGHCDYWRYYPTLKLLIIIDAKFGFIEVTPAPTNLQLRAYAVMGSQEWDVETCIVAIAQPRAGMTDDGEKLTIARYDRADITLALSQILEWEKEWLAAGAARVPGEDACRYCKAKLLCPERNARMAALRGDVKTGIADLPTEQFFTLFEAVQMAAKKDIQDAVKAEARIRAAEGRLPGYRLKPNAARRSITDEVKGAGILRESLGFSVDEVAAASSISLGSAVTVLRKKQKFKNEGLAVDFLRATLAPVIELTTPEPSIVPVSKHDEAKSV